MRVSLLLTTALALTPLACSDAPPNEGEPTETGGWHPGTVLASRPSDGPRGLLDARGLIHAHSVYSHDACDGAPRDEQTDAINQPCFDDFRRGICQVGHDFVMLSDHGESFARTDFPEVLLHRAERGDELVERHGGPVASWASCEPDASPPDAPASVLVIAGNESAMMPVGIEGHVAETEAERNAVYGTASTDSVVVLKGQGAVVLAQHTEDWTEDQLANLGFDGFEMYNLHANTIVGAGGVFDLLSPQHQPEDLPHPDLVLLNIISDDARYLDRWATVLARGYHRVTTIGTDCHQNTFPQLLADGERIDSYRRMMGWMSNHLLVQPDADGNWDDSQLKKALSERRLYGVFEVMGYAEGFDFHAVEGAAAREIGSVVSLASGVRLVAQRPHVRDLDPAGPQPTIRVVLMRAAEGGWQTVTEVEGDIDQAVDEPGAYRVEVRMTPSHLAPHVGTFTDLAEREYAWVMSNALYVE